MRAVVQQAYGPADEVLSVRDVDAPEPAKDEVLVRVHAAAMHPDMVEVEVPLWSVALALGFSAGVGIFFGIIPAFKAAIIHPIDALRHE